MRTPDTLFRILLVTLCAGTTAIATEFRPEHYQDPRGALLLEVDGKYVEPYFATKALLVAQDSGLDIREPALAWISFLLPRQRKDGRFERYCRNSSGQWGSCGQADADDSMLALWLQLLYRMSPSTGIPPQWQNSVETAASHLKSLRNRRLGVYHISHQHHAALLMDNVEVYSAFEDIAQAEERFGQHGQSRLTATLAGELAHSIQRIFLDKRRGEYRVSTQKENRRTFYPAAVAQTYPLLAELPVANREPNAAWIEWRHAHGPDWLSERRDPHPWGLIAMTAERMGDEQSAVCWLAHSEPFRYSKQWNVLEEAVFQGLQAKLADRRESEPAACSGLLAQR